MRVSIVQNIVTVAILGGHTLSYLLLGILVGIGGLFLPEAGALAALISPLFAASATAIVRYWLKVKRVSERRMNRPFAIVASVTICLCSFGVPILLWIRARNWLSDEEIAYFLGTLETGMGAAFGALVVELFPTTGHDAQPTGPAASKHARSNAGR